MSETKRRRLCAHFANGRPLQDCFSDSHHGRPDEIADTDADTGRLETITDYRKELHRVDKLSTTYGDLIEYFDFVAKDGEYSCRIQYINPFALLSWLASLPMDFFNILRLHTTFRIVLLL